MATEIIKKQLYNWEIEINFYPNSHQYKINWQNILSVSTICWVVDKSQPLIYWATNLTRDYLLWLSQDNRTDEEVIKASLQHREKKEESANIWTLAHERAEKYIKTGEMSLPEDPKVANAVNGFLERKKQHNIEFEKSELFVYSKKHNYCWITDAIGSIDWKRYLIDFKTSNSIYLLEYWMQTSAYLKAYEEETGDKLDWVMIVKFAKEETDNKWNPIPVFETQEIIEIDYLFNAFLSAKVLKEAVKKYTKW